MPRRRRNRLLRAFSIGIRRRLRRLDRHTPEWMSWLTPWGTSVVLHVLILLVFALLLVTSGRRERPPTFESDLRQLQDDLTSVELDDISGDPFTTLKTEEPPSLTFEPTPSEITNTPELPVKALLNKNLQMPGLAGPTADLGARMGGFGSTLPVNVAVTSPFAGRQGPARAAMVRREGGTVQSEEAVERGLDWIARDQGPDGGWRLDTSDRCEGRVCPKRPSLTSDTAATGLALLPMLGAGMDHVHAGRYQHVVERGIDWLVRHQAPDGDLFSGGAGNAHLYSHAIATMTLCEAFGITRDESLREPAQRAVRFIISAQNAENGGWRYFPGQAGDTSVLGWQAFALRSAHLAGLVVPDRTVAGIQGYLDAASTDGKGATYSYQPGGRPTPVMTAEALVVRQLLGWPRSRSSLREGSRLVARDLIEARERNIYYWYYGTQLLHNMQGEAWDVWNKKVRDGLVRLQVKGKECDRGSWDPAQPVADRWGRSGGRLFTTSLSVLTLEVYYRYLPLYRTSDTAAMMAGVEAE